MTTSTTSRGTITCKHCGRPELHWEKRRYVAGGPRWWRLHSVDSITGEVKMHICRQGRGKGSTPKWYAAQEAKEGITATAEATAEVSDIIEEALEEAIATVAERDFSRHVIVDELATWLGEAVHVFLVGPAGSGKTSAARAAAEDLELPYYEKSMGPQTSEWNLVGFVNPTNGQYIPGCLREPFENGGVLLLDEMDAANPGVLTTLNAALANGHYTFPDGVEVERHPDFRCVAAGNTFGGGADRVYVGRNQLDGASLDRFANVPMDYDEDAEFHWAGLDQRDWVSYVQRLRHAAENASMRVIISPRASIAGAKLLRAGKLDRATIADRLIFQKMSSDDKARLQSLVS